MMDSLTLEDIAALSESFDIECKAAQGREGRGELPDDFWKSYGAMANGEGGTIWLGIKEQPRGQFTALGIQDVDRVRKDIWDNLNNRQKVSANLLAERDIQPVSVEGKIVLRVVVPRARRQSKPVHLGTNPFGSTYIRRHEGDYPADDETVRRMMAERVEDSRDEQVLKGFWIEDLDLETVTAYRNRFSAVKPGHVWIDLPLAEFLEKIGAIGRNREEGYTALRLAGLLMFGRAEVIQDRLPYYMVDYQERPEAKTERRWIDRIVPDGTWSGNLYDFFRKVYQKLTADLKVPFQLKEGQRIDDTPLHEALREALVNTLIHADFSGRSSILVVKRPDMFGFRNPGRMRIALDLAIHGGNSDCRNRRLQSMFRLVGYGDQAGSGVPKIYHNWAEQDWRRPVLSERSEPEQTLMELHMSSLLPPEILSDLESRLGERFPQLSRLERLALVTAAAEGVLNHSRLREITTEHSTDLTRLLGRLVRDGLLVPDGTGRGMVYYLPWQDETRIGLGLEPGLGDDDFDPTDSMDRETEGRAKGGSGAPEIASKGQELELKRQELTGKRQEFEVKRQELEWPIFTQAVELPPELAGELRRLASVVRETGKTSPEVTNATVQALCKGRYLGLKLLADLLNREPQNLRRRILVPMVESGKLRYAYPRPNDPKQAYTAVLPEEMNR